MNIDVKFLNKIQHTESNSTLKITLWLSGIRKIFNIQNQCDTPHQQIAE